MPFRIFLNCRSSLDSLQYTAPAFTTGAICITVLRWMVDLQNKLAKDGPGSFRSRISLSLHRSKTQNVSQTIARPGPSSDHASGLSGVNQMTDQGVFSPLIKASSNMTSGQQALSALLSGSSSPFIVRAAEGSLVIEATSPALTCWLCTPECADLLYLAQVNIPVDTSIIKHHRLICIAIVLWWISLVREIFWTIFPKRRWFTRTLLYLLAALKRSLLYKGEGPELLYLCLKPLRVHSVSGWKTPSLSKLLITAHQCLISAAN